MCKSSVLAPGHERGQPMNTIVWDNRQDGTVWVSTDGEHYTMPTVVGEAAEAFELHVMKWDALVLDVRSFYAFDIPQEWPMGVIRAESLGDQWAQSKDGGAGLMQITGVKAGHSDEQLKADPRLN